MSSVSDFDQLWDYSNPAESERRFDQLLPAAVAGDPVVYLQILTQIARAQGLQRQFDRAHRTLDFVETALTDTDDTASANVVVIRYLLERGRVYNSEGKRPFARPFFVRAWEKAQAAGEDFYAVDAAHMLGIIEAPDTQLLWNERALELALLSPDPRAQRWCGSLYNNIGWTYHAQGDMLKALVTFERALLWQQQHGTPREVRIARWCIGRTLRSLNRIEEALALQRALLAEIETLHEQDGYIHEEIAECLLALGQAHIARPHFAAAHAHLSADAWFAANEPDRLLRMKQLSA